MSVERKLTGSINLEALTHVKRKMKGKSGEVDVLVIPIAANGFHVGEKGTYMNLNVIINDSEGQYGDIGFIAKQTGYKTVYGKDANWNDLTDEQKKKIEEMSPILGNVRDLEANSGSKKFEDAPSIDDEEDDLPF